MLCMFDLQLSQKRLEKLFVELLSGRHQNGSRDLTLIGCLFLLETDWNCELSLCILQVSVNVENALATHQGIAGCMARHVNVMTGAVRTWRVWCVEVSIPSTSDPCMHPASCIHFSDSLHCSKIFIFKRRDTKSHGYLEQLYATGFAIYN